MNSGASDRLIDIDPAMVQPLVEDAVWQSAPAGPLPPGAEPFAAPSSQAARLLPLRMEESTVCTPAPWRPVRSPGASPQPHGQ